MSQAEDAVVRFELHLARLLVVGLSLSAACLTIGVVWWLLTPESAAASLLLRSGLFVLMATPMLRVVLSVAEYVRLRDWFFVLITLIVLGLLATTVFYALSQN